MAEEPRAMTVIDGLRTRAGLAGLLAFVIVLSACGTPPRQVPVPGAAPVPATLSPPDAAPAPTTPLTVAAAVPIAPSDAPTTAPATEVAEPATMPTSAPIDATTSGEPANTERRTTRIVRRSPPSNAEPLTVVPTVTGWAAFDLHMKTILDAGSSAVSATVMRDGEVVHEVALGERNAAGEPVTIGDRYRVASISKVITSVTMLRLVEQGVVGLDDPVGERLATRVGVAAPADGVERITTRHLLTHRSGIAQYEELMFRRQVESCEQAAATGLGRDLERAPGTTLRYSNLNFCLLGLLVEDLTGRPYVDVVHDELLAPLGIDGMRLAGTFDVGSGEVEHRSDAGRNYMEVLGAAGSWVASPTQVAAIIDSLDHSTPGWKPLRPETATMMRTITQDPPPPSGADTASTTTEAPEEQRQPPPTRGYGMGLMIFGPDSFGHTGTLERTHAMTARRDDGITWAVTVSGDHPSSSRDLAGVVDEALRYAGVG